ncbi:hypothetical protein SEA_ZENITSU_12 [Microbacterium phage Zenitsu]|uniref:Uncharacterized protein n=1 Tax=Microbacterium phage MCubed TaxID=2593339 RepID=A0A514U3Z4_9CAUD|nr:hypothetical protein SEA_MCUBED_12 [Microbacterium phage MCubed]WNN93813.1 hypothetical protein SEA_ZENITSU_12 [Microbacterium phage Zenitsu]
MSNGIVVDHKETGVRYAVSESNFNPKVHEKVRDLNPGETVLAYAPRRKESLGGQASGAGSRGAAGDQAVSPSDSGKDSRTDPKTTK